MEVIMRAAAPVRRRSINVGENLYRDNISGIYYAIFKADGKQFKWSLKTKDRAIARRRLADRRRQVERMTATDGKNLSFAEYENGELVGGLAHRWFELKRIQWKPTVVDRERYTVKDLAAYFGHLAMRNITSNHVEEWAKQRAATCAVTTFNRDLTRLSQIFKYAVRKGFLLDNPAGDIQKLPVTKYVRAIPSPAEVADI